MGGEGRIEGQVTGECEKGGGGVIKGSECRIEKIFGRGSV